MTETLFRMIQDALLARWEGKLTEILARAQNFAVSARNRYHTAPETQRELEVEKLVREAYMAGYRQAYWDGVVDCVTVSVEEHPTPILPLFGGVH